MQIDKANSELRLKEGELTHIIDGGSVIWNACKAKAICGYIPGYYTEDMFPFAFKIENVTCPECKEKWEEMNRAF